MKLEFFFNKKKRREHSGVDFMFVIRFFDKNMTSGIFKKRNITASHGWVFQ